MGRDRLGAMLLLQAVGQLLHSDPWPGQGGHCAWGTNALELT